MNTETKDDVTITVRIPEKLKLAADGAMNGRFSTLSEYVRDLIRKDTDSRGDKKNEGRAA